MSLEVTAMLQECYGVLRFEVGVGALEELRGT